MKLFLPFLCLCLCLGRGSALAEDLTDAVVAQRIIKDQGYQMFHFEPATEQPRQLVLRYHGKNGKKDDHTNLLGGKKYVVTVQLGKDYVLKSVRMDSENGTMSMEFPANNFVKFNHSMNSSTIVENDPFLTLGGPDGELKLVITPRLNG